MYSWFLDLMEHGLRDKKNLVVDSLCTKVAWRTDGNYASMNPVWWELVVKLPNADLSAEEL